MTLDIPEERSHMLTNDWFIEVREAEETVALRVFLRLRERARFVAEVKSKTFLTFFQQSFITKGNVSPFSRRRKEFWREWSHEEGVRERFSE